MIALPFLTLKPRIAKQGETLVIETSTLGLLLSLTMLWRRVEVDPQRKTVTVARRVCWLFGRRQVIPFHWIEANEYSYRDMNPITDLGGTGDVFDNFEIKLRLGKSGRQVHLCSFMGPGEFVNQSVWPDWVYWEEYAFDVAGTQTSESLALVEVLQKLTGKPLGNR